MKKADDLENKVNVVNQITTNKKLKRVFKLKLPKLSTILNILYWAVFAIALFVVAGTATTVYKAPGGFRMFVVTGGSMEPTIKVGSVVLTAEKKEYHKGDIISFLRNPSDNKRKLDVPITHRIVDITTKNESAQKSKKSEKLIFTTKGDANKTPDAEIVTQDQILGKVILPIPYFGRLLIFSQTQLGFTLLVIIPVVLIVFTELQKMAKQINLPEPNKKKVENGKEKETKNIIK